MTSETANVVMFVVATMSAFIAGYSLTQTKQALELARTSNLQERQIDVCAEVIGKFAIYMDGRRVLERMQGYTSNLSGNSSGWQTEENSVSEWDSELRGSVLSKQSELLASLAQLEVYSSEDMISNLNEFRRHFWFSTKAESKFKQPDQSLVEDNFQPIKKACVSAMQGQKQGLL